MSRSRVAVGATVLLLAVGIVLGIGNTVAQQTTVTVAVEDDDGQPVADADLTVSWADGEATEQTRSNGKALVDVPEGANVTIAVDHPDYVRNYPLEVTDVGGESEITVSVARKGNAEITVRDREGPIEDARVRLYEVWSNERAVDVRTDGDGVADVGPVERGEYNLQVQKGGYFQNTSRLQVDDEAARTVELRRGSVQVRFTVVDDHFQPPRALEGASVRITQLGTTLTTLSEGDATTAVPVNRYYDVEVTMDGYETVEEGLAVSESETELNVSVHRTPELSLEATSRRVGVGERTRLTVTDEYSDPVEGATVDLEGSEVGTTDDRGEYDVLVEERGEQNVTVTADGLSAATTLEGLASDDGDDNSTAAPDDEGPGFGVPAALLALVALGAAGTRTVRQS